MSATHTALLPAGKVRFRWWAHFTVGVLPHGGEVRVGVAEVNPTTTGEGYVALALAWPHVEGDLTLWVESPICATPTAAWTEWLAPFMRAWAVPIEVYDG